MKRIVMLVAALVLLSGGALRAEERFGVPVYPGAAYDAATSKAVKDAMGVSGECFQTKDPVARVAEFYRAKGLENIGGVTKESAMFSRGKVNVTVQNPWMNMQNGSMMQNTLITIVHQGE